ncbi:molybdopterin dehydrogenase [Mycolicibacterium conceptionense]|uniref:Molybdopterin dehydrogenase n=1 Tax=Mycolicibacterium conceptionense TaxID=451644 RepID=A0A1A0PQA1_9MYCO|nr:MULTISPECIES: xanthine dehydrogenase family protein subunit M [Mycolicibacterium]MCW1824504.1 xanthine dehydrogenase family protein subunit M [Mycolicibacterium senegalense]OBB11907.1 molybdopterin dehydrogenase [Mycolicibacterium conceptionense]OBF07704.1 molybdopterin dehydrogenase [Mycolicibacterium conceptionense]OBF13834.1 molybdopterin dehydrogenase [Mycolicibacterium conceptionense]OBF47237.1 molybdopterin dehydrogenase [Mycolicibacterium conceptionense]
MKAFDFRHAESVDDAIDAATRGATYFAGGTNLFDLMKTGVEQPSSLIDLRRLGMTSITTTDTGGVFIEAGVTNSALANHHLIRTHYPVVSHAILSGATTQLRNMATAGGNLLQRTRCPYFMQTAFVECNKRKPGSGCAAINGFHREHAIFGASDQCVAIHPSDIAVAFAMLDAVVHVQNSTGRRRIPIGQFFALPGQTPEIDNTLQPHELILGIELPPSDFNDHCWYLKVRDRHSYAFALVSVAAGLRIEDGEIIDAAITLGGVAAKPWRVPEAESCLIGQRPDADAFHTAATIAMADAQPLTQNAFKVDLGRHSIVRALTLAAVSR